MARCLYVKRKLAGSLHVSSNGRQLRWSIGANSHFIRPLLEMLACSNNTLFELLLRIALDASCFVLTMIPPEFSFNITIVELPSLILCAGMLPKEESPILSGTMQCAEASLISVQTVQVTVSLLPPPRISNFKRAAVFLSIPFFMPGQFSRQFSFSLQSHCRQFEREERRVQQS